MIEHVVVKLTLKPKWHINSSSPLQGNLIATSIENIDTKNWSLLEIEYPKARLVKLGFSDEEISVYENQIDIHIKIKNNSTNLQTLL